MASRFQIKNIVAAIYLVIVLAACVPMITELAIHHGNGIAFLAASILTLPLSWIIFWIIDTVASVNAFHMTGWSYALTMAVIFGSALFNAWVIRYVVSRLFGNRDQG